MAILLQNYPGYRSAGNMQVSALKGDPCPPCPPVPLFNSFTISFQKSGVLYAEPVEILLDTGTEITLIKPEKLGQLESKLPYFLPIQGRIYFSGVPEPSYPLQLVFPHGQSYSSPYGIVAPTTIELDIGDVWVGQDILLQLIVTFNGVERTVTIEDPSR